MSEWAIEVEGLEKAYKVGFLQRKTVRALRGVTLRVPPGQVFGLIGPNGAGKSTTIKILMDLVRPSAGTARIGGLPVSDRKARAYLGYVPENPAPYEYLTGREFVTLGAQLAGLSSADVKAQVQRTLERVDLARAADLAIRRYSKGMLQRVVLASALVGRPKLLVLDEPTSGLDPVGRRLIRDLIIEERAQGTTVLFCTHIISDVETLCDRLAVLIAGQCVKEGGVAELLSGQAPTVELTLDGLDQAKLAESAVKLEAVHAVDGRVTVRLSESDLTPFITFVLARQGRVLRIQPTRFSLEDLFLEALKAAGTGTVGGVIE